MMRPMLCRRTVLASLLSLSLLFVSIDASAASPPIWNPGLEEAAFGQFGRGVSPASIDELRASVAP
jgi:hypothetical protein